MPLHKAAGVLGLLFAPEFRAWRGEQPLQLLLLVLTGYTGWIVVSVSRCADNTRELLWGTLASFLTSQVLEWHLDLGGGHCRNSRCTLSR